MFYLSDIVLLYSTDRIMRYDTVHTGYIQSADR